MSYSANSGAPYQYDYINAHVAPVTPSTVHIRGTGLAQFFARYLLQTAMSVFKWELPEEWDRDYFLYTLYCYGYIAVLQTDKYGVIPQNCGLAGYGLYYQPTRAIITNPLLSGIKDLRIHEQCTLFKLQPDYGSVMDLIGYYSDMMALAAQASGVNMINSHMAYAFRATSKAGAESMKKLYDQIASGEPAVVYDKALDDGTDSNIWQTFTQGVKQNYIALDLLQTLHYLELRFDTTLGIPNANTDKKERLVTNEVSSNDVETYSNASLWLESLKKCAEETNNMFGTEISVDWRFPAVEDPELLYNEIDEEVEDESEPVNSGAVSSGSDDL